MTLWQLVGVLAVVVAGLSLAGALTDSSSAPAGNAGARALANNPDLDAGTPLGGPAPAFTLTDQAGGTVSLASQRGKVVLLAFSDPRCTAACPLATAEMLDAKRMLGSAGAAVRLLGIDANPAATSVADVRAYTQAHGLGGMWDFLTGSAGQLRRVWQAYHLGSQVSDGDIDHAPAVYLISPSGALSRVYVTELAYSAVRQQAQILAQDAAALLPGDPPVDSHLSYQQVPSTSPTATVALPAAGAGRVRVGADGAPRLLLFFATWDRTVTDLGAKLDALDSYAAAAPAAGLPALTAVDEASVEPGPGALEALLAGLARPLSYPLAIDADGRLADGYGVEDEPWLVLLSASGQLLWHRDVATAGWPTAAELTNSITGALQHGPSAPASAAAAASALAGSPPALEALHRHSGQIVGSAAALTARLASLRGYPIVVNAWASWCTPCRAEFPLLAAAAARYGRRVAFLGADSEDTRADGAAFLATHPVSYPSYETTTEALTALAPVDGLPTTIFISPTGTVTYVHAGQYDSQGTLDQDIATHALGR